MSALFLVRTSVLGTVWALFQEDKYNRVLVLDMVSLLVINLEGKVYMVIMLVLFLAGMSVLDIELVLYQGDTYSQVLESNMETKLVLVLNLSSWKSAHTVPRTDVRTRKRADIVTR
jgi:hypothetical protein